MITDRFIFTVGSLSSTEFPIGIWRVVENMLSSDVNIQHGVVLQVCGCRQHLTKCYRGFVACWARRLTHPLNIKGWYFFEHLEDYVY